MQIILGAERNGSHQKLILWVKGGRQTAIHIFVWIEAKVCFAYFSSSSRRTPYFSLNFWFIFVGNWLTQNDGLARGFDVFYSQRLVLFCRVCVCIEGLLCFFLYKRILCRCLTHTHTQVGAIKIICRVYKCGSFRICFRGYLSFLPFSYFVHFFGWLILSLGVRIRSINSVQGKNVWLVAIEIITITGNLFFIKEKPNTRPLNYTIIFFCQL
jgi:hypothetical protein